MPLAPTVAMAAAMVRGAISLVPMIAAGVTPSSFPSARWTPYSLAVSLMAQTSSFCAMVMKATLTEFLVASATVIWPRSPGVSFLKTKGGCPSEFTQLELNELRLNAREVPSTTSLSVRPDFNHSVRVKIL